MAILVEKGITIKEGERRESEGGRGERDREREGGRGEERERERERERECVYACIQIQWLPHTRIIICLTFAHSPLHIAAKSGLVVVVKDLINRGADLNVRDADGMTIIMPELP